MHVMAGPTEVPDLADVVLALRTAELAANHEPLEFHLIHSGGMERGVSDDRGAWQDDAFAPTHTQVDQLEDQGMVRVTRADGIGRMFYLTDKGRNHARLLGDRLQPKPANAVDLGWDAARPLLEAIVAAYEAGGAPEFGIDVQSVADDASTENAQAALLRQLRLHDLVETSGETDSTGPRWVAPTARALQLLRRWPASSAEAILDELVAALTARIEQTTDQEERTTLVRARDAVTGAARDIVIGVLSSQISGSL